METIIHTDPRTETVVGSSPASEAVPHVTQPMSPPRPRQELPADAGRLAALLVRAMRAKKLLEIGSEHGACTTWLLPAAEAVGAQHAVIEPAADRMPALESLRDAHEATVTLDICQGDAADTLPRLGGPFDVAVLNVREEEILPAFRAVFSRLRVGGVVVVLGASPNGEAASALRSHQQATATLVDAGLPVAVACKLG